MNEPAKRLAHVFNLSDYESRLYFAALDEPNTTISALAVRAGIPRTAVYPPLKQLIMKGFISSLPTKGKRTLYRAVDPKHLENIFERRRADLKEIVKQFSDSIAGSSGETWVRYFEGREGIHTAADIFLHETKVTLWKTFENIAYVERLIGARQFDEYVKRRVARGISARVILSAREQTPWMEGLFAKSEENLLEIQIVSPEAYPIEASFAVSGDWVFMESAKKKPFAILIKNEVIARTMESIHDMAWDRYRPT